MHVHPGKKNGAAPGNEICDSLISHNMLCRLPVQSCMNGHEIHAVLRMLFHHGEKVIGSHILEALMKHAFHIVHGHRADGSRTVLHQPLPERRRLPVAGQIHNGLRLHLPGHLRLRLLRFIIAHILRNPQIHIHLRAKPLADGIGMKRCMILIGRNDDGALRNPLTDKLRRNAFLPRRCLHFLRNDTLLGRFQLCHMCLPFHA